MITVKSLGNDYDSPEHNFIHNYQLGIIV